MQAFGLRKLTKVRLCGNADRIEELRCLEWMFPPSSGLPLSVSMRSNSLIQALLNQRIFIGLATVVLSIIASSGCHSPKAIAQEQKRETAKPKVRVEIVRPTVGGLLRSSSQPGTAHSYESADLYPKLSGFLKNIAVDIGTVVKAGDVLAELDVPELQQDVLAATAALNQAVAEVAQAAANVQSVTADQKAAEAKVLQTKAEQQRIASDLTLAEKQLTRMRELNQLRAIEDRIVDEKTQQLASARASVSAAESTTQAAEQEVLSARARIALAESQLNVMKAKQQVAQSQLERTRVMAAYTSIVSPYDGVITARNFHRGAYIRSPDHGGDKPILSVDRTDLMRVVLRIPERDVPHVHKGDLCQIQFDAFPKQTFKGPIARIAATEDSATRTMAVEIDLPNPDGLIRDHMYGRVFVALEEATNAQTIPSTCIIGDATDGKAKVYVVRNGKLQLKAIEIGRDTGVELEVLAGLSADDQVVARPANGLSEGIEVDSVPMLANKTSH